MFVGDYMEDFKFKKKFGQNFLKDINIVKKIVRCADISDNSLTIEVGPGAGIMTKELASVSNNVIAYEIDNELKDKLNDNLGEFSNINILFKDFLESNIKEDINNYSYDNLYFVSNVPYYITTPIIIKLIESELHFKRIVMMVQKEVGDRFSSIPGSKQYGSISVFLNYFFEVKKEFLVSRKQFIPEPNVDSVIISFTEKDNKLELNNFKHFERLVKDSFQFKRKTIRNNLKNYDLDIIDKVLNKFGYDLSVRAEMLSYDIFVSISNELTKKP